MFLVLPAYLLGVAFLFLHMVKSRNYKLATNLGLIALVGYGLVWASYLSGLIDYNEPLSVDAVAYTTGAFLCFALGNWIGDKLPCRGSAAKVISVDIVNSALVVGGLLGTVGLFAYIANYFYSGLANMDAHAARSIVLAGEFHGHPVLAKVGYFCGPCGLIASLLAVMAGHRLNMFTRWIVYLGFLSGPAYSITILGRMSIIPVFSAVVLLALLCMARGTKFKLGNFEKIVFISGGLIIVSYMLLLPLFRIREADKTMHTLDVLNSQPSSILLWIVDNVPSAVGDTLVQGVAYTSSQPVMLSRFWESADVGPYWGLWQFSNFSSRILRREFKMPEIREELHEQSNILGLFGNTWATAVRDAMIDFGSYGALLQMLILGLVGGVGHRRFLKNGTIGAGLIYAVIGGWVAFSFSVSATLLAYYEVSLLGIIVLCSGGLFWLRPESVRSEGLAKRTAAPDRTAEGSNSLRNFNGRSGVVTG